MQHKSGKICKTCLTNHTQSMSNHIMKLVINDLGGGCTHTHQRANQSNLKQPGADTDL